MSDTFSTSLRFQIQTVGGNPQTWGGINNTNIGSLVEQAIAGAAHVSMVDADYTLVNNLGASDEARNALLVIASGTTTLTATRKVFAPAAASKGFAVANLTTGTQAITVCHSGGSSGVTIPNGASAMVFSDGTAFGRTAPLVNIAAGGTFGAANLVPVVSYNVDGQVTSISTASIGSILTSAGQLTGGGDVTASRTLGLSTSGATPGTYGAGLLTVDTYGRITAGTSGALIAAARLTGGTFAGGTNTFDLNTSGVTPGTYSFSQVVVDTYGRVTSATSGSAGSGSVTSVVAASPLTGGTISTSGTVGLATSGVTTGTYGSAGNIPQITVDTYGRITAVSNVSVPSAAGTNTWSGPNIYTGTMTASGPLDLVSGYAEKAIAMTISSGTTTMDFSKGNSFTLALTTNATLAFANAYGSGTETPWLLSVNYNGTSYSMTWGTNVKWPGATAPTLSTGSGKIDSFVGYSTDGTTHYAYTAGQNS